MLPDWLRWETISEFIEERKILVSPRRGFKGKDWSQDKAFVYWAGDSTFMRSKVEGDDVFYIRSMGLILDIVTNKNIVIVEIVSVNCAFYGYRSEFINERRGFEERLYHPIWLNVRKPLIWNIPTEPVFFLRWEFIAWEIWFTTDWCSKNIIIRNFDSWDIFIACRNSIFIDDNSNTQNVSNLKIFLGYNHRWISIFNTKKAIRVSTSYKIIDSSLSHFTFPIICKCSSSNIWAPSFRYYASLKLKIFISRIISITTFNNWPIFLDLGCKDNISFRFIIRTGQRISEFVCCAGIEHTLRNCNDIWWSS